MVGVTAPSEQQLMLRPTPERSRGFGWLVVISAGVAISGWQFIYAVFLSQFSAEAYAEHYWSWIWPSSYVWSLVAASAILCAAGVLTGLWTRSVWASLPFAVSGVLTAWIYTAVTFYEGNVASEWAQSLTWLALSVGVATTPFVDARTSTGRITAAALAIMLPVSLWFSRITSPANLEWLEIVDWQGLSIDPAALLSTHTAYLGFHHWARLAEGTAATAAAAAVLTRSRLLRRWPLAAAAALIFVFTTSDLWAELIGDGYPFNPPVSDPWDSDPKALLPVPVIIVVVAAVWLRRWARARRPVRHLARPITPVALRAALRAAVADPTVDLHFLVPESGSWVDVDGRPASPLATSGQRWQAAITGPSGAGPLARIDAANHPDHIPLVARVIIDASRILLDVREQALSAAHTQQLEASRRRIAETAIDERRRLERDLHDGAQQRLLALSTRLAVLRNGAEPPLQARLDAAASELQRALTELRDLAQGIHPAILSQAGLAAAIESLTMSMDIPVSVTIPATRFPPAVESTLYFVTSEALANITKHSKASSASVAIRVDGAHVHLTVHDNGQGGAAAGHGTGLRNLLDRVEALGGTATITSPTGLGTTIDTHITLDSATAPDPTHGPPTSSSPTGASTTLDGVSCASP